MMEFSPTSKKRTPPETIVPMINVVFLLLIFFLMSAQIAPRDPVKMAPPTSESDALSKDRDTLYLGEDGALWFEDTQGAAVWEALAAREGSEPLRIKADASIPARQLAALLPRLAAIGQSNTILVVGAK